MTRIAALAGALILLDIASANAQGLTPRAEELSTRTDAQVVEWRRHVHSNPELSYQEVQTAAYIADALRAMPGIEVRTGIAKTGVKAVLKGGRPGPVVALRADMDALPVEEKGGVPFASKVKAPWFGKDSFVAHVCGHDTHVAMLLGAAKVLSQMRETLPGTVVFLFQPAEEWGNAGGVPSGATQMVKEGVLDNPKVDVVFGQHISAEAPSGTIGVRRGAAMASGDDFKIVVKGKGTHGAYPWKGRDPIVVAAEIALSLQAIVSRELDLVENGVAVVTIGAIRGGNRENIISEEAEMIGTIRTLSEVSRVQARESLKRRAEKIAEASGMTAEVTIEIGYPVLANDAKTVDFILPALERAAGPGKVSEVMPILASEDFGSFGAGIPTVYWTLRASPLGDKPGPSNHSPFFVVDESAMKVGVRALLGATLKYLEAGAARR